MGDAADHQARQVAQAARPHDDQIALFDFGDVGDSFGRRFFHDPVLEGDILGRKALQERGHHCFALKQDLGYFLVAIGLAENRREFFVAVDEEDCRLQQPGVFDGGIEHFGRVVGTVDRQQDFFHRMAPCG